jgi:hypothetical protein
MHDARGVRRLQSSGNLRPDVRRVVDGQRAPFEPLFQRLAGVIGHRNERLPLPGADLIDRRDVRMVDRALRLCLTQEPLLGLGSLRGRFAQELQRDFAMQMDVFGEIHHAHPARADVLDDAIVRDRGADHREWPEV